jgi:hypothetical protein
LASIVEVEVSPPCRQRIAEAQKPSGEEEGSRKRGVDFQGRFPESEAGEFRLPIEQPNFL